MDPQQSNDPDDTTTIIHNGPDNQLLRLPLLEVSVKSVIIDGGCRNDFVWHMYTEGCF